jgi:DMSO/TMAO reductase YedYZ molybdopterin-dependent catalytic subunit
LGEIPTHLFAMNSCANTIRAAIDRVALHWGPAIAPGLLRPLGHPYKTVWIRATSVLVNAGRTCNLSIIMMLGLLRGETMMDSKEQDFGALSSGGLIIRQREPKNLEGPFYRIDSYLTLECAGNSRVFLVPQVQGAQWELGAVSNAEWTGVPLRALLERAVVREDVCEILLEGADRGIPKEVPAPPEPISYFWSLPRAKAVQPEVLIAYQMNGRDLSQDHGFPVRAIVPGHYGMASVKWLTRIRAVREPFHGYWQTTDYAYWASTDGMAARRALGEMKLKSEIARPRVYETLVPNRIYTVSGAAWAGETDVTGVAVSTNGGQTWANAEFLDPARRHAWRRWKFDWLTPKEPGKYTLFARARDAGGRVQPAKHDQNFGNYVINHSLPIEVFVGHSGGARQ